jgi:hypothetical protein
MNFLEMDSLKGQREVKVIGARANEAGNVTCKESIGTKISVLKSVCFFIFFIFVYQ